MNWLRGGLDIDVLNVLHSCFIMSVYVEVPARIYLFKINLERRVAYNPARRLTSTIATIGIQPQPFHCYPELAISYKRSSVPQREAPSS